MLKVVVQTFVTLDGVYQAPGDSKEDTAGGFTHGGWQMAYWDDATGKIMDQQMAETEALLLGRKTYEIFAAYWPNAAEDDAIAKKFNSIPKYVASTTLKKADWKGTQIISSNLAEAVGKARQAGQKGIILVAGSGNLAQSLEKGDLVDEWRLWIHPLVLGTGKRLFDNGVVPANLKLLDAKTTDKGIQILTLVPQRP